MRDVADRGEDRRPTQNAHPRERTTGNVHSGTFDNQFWINGTTGGHMLACGFVSGTTGTPLIPSNPKMYMFPFEASHLITSTGSTSWAVNNTKGDECSPLTEF